MLSDLEHGGFSLKGRPTGCKVLGPTEKLLLPRGSNVALFGVISNMS